MKIKSNIKKPHWPYSKFDIKEVAIQAQFNNFYMPNIGYIKIDTTNKWDTILDGASNSKRLWINSLVSAHACLVYSLEDPAHTHTSYFLELGYKILISWIENSNLTTGTFQDAWKDEHAVTNRLFVLTAFIHYISELNDIRKEKNLDIEKIFNHALIHAEWLNSDHNYVMNNHGVMMDLALAQFSVLLSNIDKTLQNRYLETSHRRLVMMFNRTFDKKGCCTENSSSYHFVNYSLFSAISDFFHKYQIPSFSNSWIERINQSREVGNLLLRQDGSIPLIGDSEEKIGTFFPPYKEESDKYGLGFYPESGFFIASLPHFHFTLKAGGISYSHRHIDDLSITLQVNKRDFIVDCGMYNYDINDKKRRWFISTQAHSGIYLKSTGDVRFAHFSSPMDMSRFLSFDKKAENQFLIQGTHNLSKEAEIKRVVEHYEGYLIIEDSFESELEQHYRIQFNLHPDVEINQSNTVPGSFKLTNKDTSINIEFPPEIETIKKENINYSKKFMQLENSTALVAQGQAKSLRAKTIIKLTAK